MTRMEQVKVWLVLVFVITGLNPAAADDPTDEEWQVIYIQGKRVGYSRFVSRKAIENGKPIFVSEIEEHFKFRRFGQTLQMDSQLRIRETDSGEIIGYTFSVKNPPAEPALSTAVVDGRFMRITTVTGNRKRERTIDWNRSWKSPGYQERILRKEPLKAGQRRSFKMFVPELEKPTDIHMTADGFQSVKLQDGSTKRLLKVRVDQTLMKLIKTRVFTDEQGNALRTEMDPLGMVVFSVSKRVALEQIAGEELDVAVNSLIRPKNPPPNLASASAVTFRITTSGRDATQFFQDGPGQRVRKVSNETIEVTVTPPSIPKNKRVRQLPKSIVDKYLADSKFIQMKDLLVKGHARKAAAGNQDPGTIAERIQNYVFRAMKKKGFSTLFGSAAEVAKNLEGDCTEHSCLFAAMLRANQIPSRVAVGLVYAPQLGAFSSHMWTEAYIDGQWIPLDASLQAGFGAGHLRVGGFELADDDSPALGFAPMLDLVRETTIEVIEIKR